MRSRSPSTTSSTEPPSPPLWIADNYGNGIRENLSGLDGQSDQRRRDRWVKSILEPIKFGRSQLPTFERRVKGRLDASDRRADNPRIGEEVGIDPYQDPGTGFGRLPRHGASRRLSPSNTWSLKTYPCPS